MFFIVVKSDAVCSDHNCHSVVLLTSWDKMEAGIVVAPYSWCCGAAATGAFHSQHSAHHVTQAANQVAQADCLQTGQISPGPAAILDLHASWVGNWRI